MYIRLRAARGDLDEAVVVYSDNKFEWTTKPRLERRMELLRSDELYDYFGAELALEDTRLAYVFRLRSGGEVSYLCEEGVSGPTSPGTSATSTTSSTPTSTRATSCACRSGRAGRCAIRYSRTASA